jgi:hypothetical protein
MKDPGYERLREASWRRKLTPAEEAELRLQLDQHPELFREWESQRELTEVLARLQNAPVPSNFTARVLAEAQRETRQPSRSEAWGSWHARLRWLPRLAVASVVLAAGLISYEHVQDSRRKERAESVKAIVSYTAVPGPDILQDYDAIQAMSQSPAADVELLKALQ